MKVVFHRLMLSVVVIGLSLSSVASTSARAATNKADEVKAAYIMDAKTGQAVYAQDADKELPIASLSKLMTLYLVETAIKQHQIKWDDVVPINKEVRKMAASSTLSTMPMAASDQFTVRELFAATLVGSSNSSAIALGEYVAGSNPKFIKMMNAQADKWGLAAHFVSASGLDNSDLTKYNLDIAGTSAKAQNLVSARAITTVAAHLVNEYPDIVKVSNQKSVKIHKYTVPTSVLILKGEKYYDSRVPVDGLKTGYTDQAGDCLVATFKQNGRRMIATTLGGTWKFTANNDLRLMVKDEEVYHQVMPSTINYQIPGTQTHVKLVAKQSTTMWENKAHPMQQVKTTVWPLHQNRPNYLAAKTTVLQVKLTDPQSGAVKTIDYQTPHAMTLLGPIAWATTNHVSVQNQALDKAFALVD
ncbi:D-alanyl-D-alanine carboxypeptidase [Lactiplantibacillus fabifermentans T30PCM01]|uniref:D-alanyl-D-alanine carboxypeptidase n=1 Tax=Lactiplantibacillus fabifermentans T30PCM01 TaxID=1400520 RepID=W6T8C1_9LACO|nr:D-alanyl-D-alanine carboxypeptidase [Lactiplantibacillus fabifermentans T30PCM01]